MLQAHFVSKFANPVHEVLSFAVDDLTYILQFSGHHMESIRDLFHLLVDMLQLFSPRVECCLQCGLLLLFLFDLLLHLSLLSPTVF